MSLNTKDVEKIAHLARLNIEGDDADHYANQLSSILGFIEQMNSADTDNIEPLAHSVETTQRLRADEVTEDDQRDKYLSIAPASEAGLYLVPLVIEEV